MEKHMVYKYSIYIGIVVGLTLLICGCQNSGSEEKIAPKVSKAAEPATVKVVAVKRGDLIRVISARDMNKKEREFYNEKG